MRQRIETGCGAAIVYSANGTPDGQPESFVYIAPGFSEGKVHMQGVVDQVADLGYHAFTHSQPRRTGRGAERTSEAIGRQGLIAACIVESAVPQKRNLHGAGHSMGSAALLRAAQILPRRFDGLSLHQPLGVAGRQTQAGLALRVARKEAGNFAQALHGQSPDHLALPGRYCARVDDEPAGRMLLRVLAAQAAGTRTLALQPATAWRESMAAGAYDLSADTSAVSQQGTPVYVYTAHGDELFENGAVYSEYIEGACSTVTGLSVIADRAARHDTFWMQPERTAHLIDQAIKASLS